MLQLQINKKTISIPSVLSEIPLYKGIEVMQFAYGKKDISYIDKLAIISTLS